VFFQEGEVYERGQITDVFEAQKSGYLPLSDGKVACGLFDLSSDAVTHFSGELEVFPKRLSAGAKLLEEGDVIPVFLKVGTKQWRYAGKYKLADKAKDKRSLDKARELLGRDEVSVVLKFTPEARPA
jgi:hypothetical protein